MKIALPVHALDRTVYTADGKYVASADNEEFANDIVSALNAQRWIPVVERLPETDESVLMLTDGLRLIGDYNKFDRKWRIDPWEELVDFPPTHWQPLPPAPGSEG